MTINERIEQIIENLYRGNKRAFANAIGVAPTVVENVVGTRQGKPSYGLLEKICAIENISIEWVITGEGSMLKSNISLLSYNSKNSNEDYKIRETRPRIPFEAAAGSLSLIAQSVTEAQCEQIPIVPRFPAYDFSIIVKGDSMEPEFHSGDELACKILRQSSFIQWGRPYIVDCMDGVVLKRIHDAGDDILCTSDNKNYGDFKIPKREINHLAIVIGMIRLF